MSLETILSSRFFWGGGALRSNSNSLINDASESSSILVQRMAVLSERYRKSRRLN